MKKYLAKFPNAAIEKKFSKALAQLSKSLQANVMEEIAKLQDNPRPFSDKLFTQIKPPVKLYEFVAHFRIRIGEYRVLYDIDDDRAIVWTFALRKRNEKTYRSR